VSTPQRQLPLPYAVLLVAELAVLGTVVASVGRAAPYRDAAGYAAIASFAVMQLYSLRRRVRGLRDVGTLAAWLDFHVFAGLQGCLFVAYHAVGLTPALDLANVTGLVVVALVATGIIGRYLFRYVQNAKTEAIWSFVHRPLAFLLLSLATLHVLAHFAYAR
jgi:hypothetical protein